MNPVLRGGSLTNHQSQVPGSSKYTCVYICIYIYMYIYIYIYTYTHICEDICVDTHTDWLATDTDTDTAPAIQPRKPHLPHNLLLLHPPHQDLLPYSKMTSIHLSRAVFNPQCQWPGKTSSYFSTPTPCKAKGWSQNRPPQEMASRN